MYLNVSALKSGVRGCVGELLIAGGQREIIQVEVLEVEQVFFTIAVESGVGDQSQENSPR